MSGDVAIFLVDLDNPRQKVLEGPVVKYRGDQPISIRWILGREIFIRGRSELTFWFVNPLLSPPWFL
jgi:hypothetical protein